MQDSKAVSLGAPMKPQERENTSLMGPCRKPIVPKMGGKERCLPIKEIHIMVGNLLDREIGISSSV